MIGCINNFKRMSRARVCVYVCVCVCVFSKTAFPLYLKVLHDTLGSQRCSRDCSGVLVVASLEETQGVLWWVGGGITRGGAGGALLGSNGLVVAPLEKTQRLLSRFDSVYPGYITQGSAEGALVGCYEPTGYVPNASFSLPVHTKLFLTHANPFLFEILISSN